MERYFAEWVHCLDGEEDECKEYLMKWKKFELRKLGDPVNVKEHWIDRGQEESALPLTIRRTIGLKLVVEVPGEST